MKALVAALLKGMAGAAVGAEALQLHVPSPDWRDQVIYFVVTDRFADGDAANNDQGRGEFKAGDHSRYNGGDFKGLVQQLPYIRGLGATALWVTPPVANQWLDAAASYSGYHGYWAENLLQVDRHLGSLADFQLLSHTLHSQGMYLVQDIVVNHMGNFFGYGPGWNAAHPAQGWQAFAGTPPVARPSQPPFDQNNPQQPAQRQAAIYHWTPEVGDYTRRLQELNFQMAGLDDLNTENPVVRRALRASYGHWIRQAGVDAFRVDTAFYVPPGFFGDFLHSRDHAAPGIARVAAGTGRRQFHVFGEGFGIDKPGRDEQSRKIESYMHGPGGRPLLGGMLNFPLYGALGDVFARGRPAAELGQRITGMLALHRRVHWMPTFIDNHDVDRFLAGGSQAALKQALLALMTLPGIPVVYYGTEQGFTEQRAAMFAAGVGSGGRDRYDSSAPLYKLTAEVIALRRADKLFSRGLPRVLAGNTARPGALAWKTVHGRDSAIVVFNSADSETLLAGLPTGLAAGTTLQGVYGLHGRPGDVLVGVGGAVTLRLPARSGMVFKPLAGRAAPGPATAGIVLQPPPLRATGNFDVHGTARGVEELLLVVDGDIAQARSVRPDAQGRWRATVDTSAMADSVLRHSVVAWAEGRAASASHPFTVKRPWQLLIDQTDPVGDDHGPTGSYRYPTGGGWGAARPMDLQRVRVSGSGGALRLDIKLNSISTRWNPANGFDHVAFTIFIELPGRDGGATLMPLQNASLPGGMRWHLRLRAHGWSNTLFSAAAAAADHEGTPVTPAAAITTDASTGTVSFTLPAAALGNLKSLSGARIYVSTWDYDGGYRAIAPQAQGYTLGGGAVDAPKVMDDSLIVLP